MSLRPSGCGGRSDAVPPHVENRRRFSGPSSIIGPAGASSVQGGSGGRRRQGRRGDERAAKECSRVDSRRVIRSPIPSSVRVKQWRSKHKNTRRRAQGAGSGSVWPTAPPLSLTHSLPAMWVRASKYLIRNKPSAAYSLCSGWEGSCILAWYVLRLIFLCCCALPQEFLTQGTLHCFAQRFSKSIKLISIF